MNWLFPSVIATLTGTLLLVFVYAYFYFIERESYFKIWTVSWLIYMFRYVLMLAILVWGENPCFLMGNQLCALVSGVLLLWGAQLFLGKKNHRVWWGITLCGCVWIVYSIWANLPFFIMAFPTFTLMAVIYIWTGIAFLRFDDVRGVENYIIGVGFILWGIHKADYPFLRPVEWFAPWGYLFGALMEFVVAIGLILIYFRKTQSELFDNQRKFRQLSENIKDVFWVGGSDWKTVTYISPAYETIWGRTCGSVYKDPMSWFESVHPDDRPHVFNTIEAFQQRQEREVIFPEYRIKRPDGGIRWIFARAYPIKNNHGEITGIAGIASDITQWKATEKSLSMSEDRVSTIFKAAENVSFIITDAKDPEPGILEFSAGAEKIFGYSREEMVGHPVSVLHLPEDVDRFPEVHARMRQGKTGFRGEATLVRKNGETFPALFASYPLLDEAENMYAALGVSIDISEQKKLESRLQQAHKLEAVGTLAGGVAHDVNNILGVIIGNTELAMDETPEYRPAHKYLKEIMTASQRASDVVRQLLKFSRKSEPERKPVQLDVIVNEALKLIRATIPKTIGIEVSVSPSSRLVEADATQVQQVLMDLCTNAAHAMEETGGTLEVHHHELAIDDHSLKNSHGLSPGNYAVLTVSDTGNGIDQEILGQIFDPYFTTKEVGKGTGMGLAVVHGIVKDHGGGVSVYSEPGKGSTFKVYFPQMKDIPFVADDIVETITGGSESILIVDDEPAFLTMLKQMLERLGYQVLALGSSEEALRVFQETPERFDLLITDMTMPGMAGDRLAREVLSIRKGLPVILCTGFSEKINEESARKIGVRRFIDKPIDKYKLSIMLRDVLDKTSG